MEQEKLKTERRRAQGRFENVRGISDGPDCQRKAEGKQRLGGAGFDDGDDEPPVTTDEDKHAATRIVGMKGSGKSLKYHIEWEGFADNDNTWEPAENILDVSLITDFNKRTKATASKKKKACPKPPLVGARGKKRRSRK